MPTSVPRTGRHGVDGWAANFFVERRKEEKEEDEEEEVAEDFLGWLFLSHGSPAQLLVVDVPVLMQRRLGWSLRRFAWLERQLGVAFGRISLIFYVQMETRVLGSTLVLLFLVLVAQHLVRQWILVLRQFLGRGRGGWKNFHIFVLVTSYPEVDFVFSVVATPVELPQVQFLDKVYMPVVVSGADGQTAQKTVEIPQVPFLDKVYMPVVLGLVPMARQCSSFSF